MAIVHRYPKETNKWCQQQQLSARGSAQPKKDGLGNGKFLFELLLDQHISIMHNVHTK